MSQLRKQYQPVSENLDSICETGLAAWQRLNKPHLDQDLLVLDVKPIFSTTKKIVTEIDEMNECQSVRL